MSDTGTPPPPTADDQEDLERAQKEVDKRRKRRVEFLGAIIIAIAAVLTAFATFKTSDADGIVERKNTEGITLSLLANDAYNDHNRIRGEERDWLFSWITQQFNGQFSADLLLAAMPNDVAMLASEWLEAEATGDPFSGQYPSFEGLTSNGHLALGNERFRLAQCAFFEAQEAAVKGDGLGVSTVFLAVALVVGGIAALLNGKGAQVIVIAIAALSLMAGAALFVVADDVDEVRAAAAAVFFVNEDGTPLIATDVDGEVTDIPAALKIVNEACPEIARAPSTDGG